MRSILLDILEAYVIALPVMISIALAGLLVGMTLWLFYTILIDIFGPHAFHAAIMLFIVWTCLAVVVWLRNRGKDQHEF